MKYAPFYLVLLFFSTFLNQAIAQKKVLVVSGGGARGAWGGGVAQHLVEKQKQDYDVVIGTSTGSLMAPLIVQEDFVRLREMYTSVTTKSIFSVNPFRFRKNDEGRVVEADIRGFRAVKRLVFGKKTLGETKNLRKLIEQTYPAEKYQDIVSKGEFIIAVANFTNSDEYYFSSNDYNNEQDDRYRKIMLDHIWRSSNQPLFMTLDCSGKNEIRLCPVDMDGRRLVEGDCWVDAGIRDNVPLLRGIQYVLENDDDDQDDVIDVVINNTEGINIEDFESKKILPSLIRTINILSYDVRFNDVNIPGELIENTLRQVLPETMQRASDEELANIMRGSDENDEFGNIRINLHFMTQPVFDAHPLDLYFNKESMNNIWEKGLAFEEGKTVIIKSEMLNKRVAMLLIKEAKRQHLLAGLSEE